SACIADLAIVAAICSSAVRSCDGAGSGETDIQRRAHGLLAGMRDQRERLRRGLVRGSGQMFKPFPSGTVRGPIKFLYAFDRDMELLHVERDDPRPTRGAAASTEDVERADVKDLPIVTWHFAHIHRPDRSVHMINVAGSQDPSEIQVNKADFKIRREGVIDIRTVGLLAAVSYEHQASWADLFKHLNDRPPDEVVDEGAGLWRIRWPTTDGLGRNSLWIDRSKGFSPVRFEMQHKLISREPNVKGGWPEPFGGCEATWTEINGVWVPLTYRIEDQQYRDAEGRPATYEHEFNWELVNEPIPLEWFEIESLHAPKGTLVTDHRGQDIVLTRVIGEPDNRDVGTTYSIPTAGEPSRIVYRVNGHGIWIFVGMSALGIVLILLLYGLRRSKETRG
ncbi:MAG TPA: hypothetical protein VF278_20215, partial [Pirellulales bacterium]